MTRRNRRRPNEPLAADLGPDDGLDAREFHDRRQRHALPTRNDPGRKARQLCEQVRQALMNALSSLGDEVLHNLQVVSVEPAPNTGRLRVTVAVATVDVADRTIIEEHLATAYQRLRWEIAQAIHRRKVPELMFNVQP